MFMYEASSINREWKVTKFKDHEDDCPIFDPIEYGHRRFVNHRYSAEMFVPLIQGLIEGGLSHSHMEITNRLIYYVDILPSRQFAHWVRLDGLKQFIGI